MKKLFAYPVLIVTCICLLPSKQVCHAHERVCIKTVVPSQNQQEKGKSLTEISPFSNLLAI